MIKHNRQDDIIKELSVKYNIDHRVCKEIINSPFLYLKHMITSSNIEDGIRLPYFGAFCQKGGHKNKTMRAENRKNILLDNVLEVATMMAATLGFVVPTVESAKNIITTAFEEGDYDKLNMIWDAWQEFKG